MKDLLELIQPGKMIEIQGDESSGKTTTVLNIIKEFQEQDKLVIYIDLDKKINWDYFNSIIDIDELFICQPNNVDELLTFLDAILKDNKVDLIVLDSIGMLTNGKEDLQGVKKALSKLTALMFKYNVACIIVNQYRYYKEELVPMYNKMIQMYSSVRLQTQLSEDTIAINCLSNKLSTKRVNTRIELQVAECIR